jgi:cytoskeletal protein CcmA (bactofilin family)
MIFAILKARSTGTHKRKQAYLLPLQSVPTPHFSRMFYPSCPSYVRRWTLPKLEQVASRHELGYSSGKTQPQQTRPRENKKHMKPAEGSTVIGKSVVIRGELSGSEDLYIDGDVEGTVTLPESRLTIGPNARAKADIHVRDVIVFGHLTGNIQATGRVDLRQSAIVNGDILAGRLSIEESAVLTGRVELKVTSEVPKPATPAVAVPPPAQPSASLFSQPKA